MSDRIGGLGVGGFQPNLGASVDAQVQQQTKGSSRGETVTVNTGPSMLSANSTEEMTFGAAEHRKPRELKERKLEDTGASRMLDAIKQIEAYKENLKDFDTGKADTMLAGLKRREGRPSQEELQRRLQGFHEDITYQQAALEQMARALEQSGDDPALLAVVHDTIASNVREQGPAIMAGLNITPIAAATGGTHGEVQELRDFYRDRIFSKDSIRQSFENILQHYGNEDVGGRIQFLIKATGADITAAGPSMPKEHLLSVVSDLHQLETLATLREQVTDALTRGMARFKPEAAHA